MATVLVNGYTMTYVEAGKGVPLLLIHGAFSDYRWWTPQMEPLAAAGYRVIAPSLRYYYPERWDGTGGQFTVQQHVDDVGAFIGALGIAPVHLLGHSRGGHVAFRVAQSWPDRVTNLILAEPGGSLDKALSPADSAPPISRSPTPVDLIRAGDIDGGLELAFNSVVGPGAWANWPEALKQHHRDNARTLLGHASEQRTPFSRSDVEAIKAPTLLIGGDQSGTAFVTVLDAFERVMRNARRVTIPDASHPMNKQNPTAFNSAVLTFLNASR